MLIWPLQRRTSHEVHRLLAELVCCMTRLSVGARAVATMSLDIRCLLKLKGMSPLSSSILNECRSGGGLKSCGQLSDASKTILFTNRPTRTERGASASHPYRASWVLRCSPFGSTVKASRFLQMHSHTVGEPFVHHGPGGWQPLPHAVAPAA